MKFRKKPNVIDAEQWFPPGDDRHKPIDGVVLGGDTFEKFAAGLRKHYVVTLEGPLTVSEGDWIITGVNGEKYPCKPDVFDKTYEAVE